MAAFFDSLDEMVTKCFSGNHKATMAATETFVTDISDTQDNLETLHLTSLPSGRWACWQTNSANFIPTFPTRNEALLLYIENFNCFEDGIPCDEIIDENPN